MDSVGTYEYFIVHSRQGFLLKQHDLHSHRHSSSDHLQSNHQLRWRAGSRQLCFAVRRKLQLCPVTSRLNKRNPSLHTYNLSAVLVVHISRKEKNGKAQVKSATKIIIKTFPITSFIWHGCFCYQLWLVSAKQCQHLLQANSCLWNIQGHLLAADFLVVHQWSTASLKSSSC